LCCCPRRLRAGGDGDGDGGRFPAARVEFQEVGTAKSRRDARSAGVSAESSKRDARDGASVVRDIACVGRDATRRDATRRDARECGVGVSASRRDDATTPSGGKKRRGVIRIELNSSGDKNQKLIKI